MRVMENKAKLFHNTSLALCVFSLISLFFTFATSTIEASIGDIGSSSDYSVSGWTAAFASFFGWILIAAPAAIIGMKYIESFQDYEQLASFALPVITIIVEYVLLLGTDLFNSIGDTYGTVSIETTTSAGTGFYFILLAQIGILVCKALYYKHQPQEKKAE